MQLEEGIVKGDELMPVRNLSELRLLDVVATKLDPADFLVTDFDSPIELPEKWIRKLEKQPLREPENLSHEQLAILNTWVRKRELVGWSVRNPRSKYKPPIDRIPELLVESDAEYLRRTQQKQCTPNEFIIPRLKKTHKVQSEESLVEQIIRHRMENLTEEEREILEIAENDEQYKNDLKELVAKYLKAKRSKEKF